MKLKTEMQDFHGRMLPRDDKKRALYFSFEHDAAAAQALMQAIHNMGNHCILEDIKADADAIMAEWGFEE